MYTEFSSSYSFAALHRRELRPGRRQPSGAGGLGGAPQVHDRRKSPSLRRRSGDNQVPGELRHQNRNRRGQRRHSESGLRSTRRLSGLTRTCCPTTPKATSLWSPWATRSWAPATRASSRSFSRRCKMSRMPSTRRQK